MSRFTNYSPKPERVELVSSNTTEEDEIIQSILRKRQQRMTSTRLNDASREIDASTGSDTNDIFATLAQPDFSTPSRKQESQDKTPYNLLRRLARTNLEDRDVQPSTMEECLEVQARALYASSVTSHTTASVEEAIALLEQNTNQNTHLLNKSQRYSPPQAQDHKFSMAKAESPAKVVTDDMGPINRAFEKANRTLFTPDTRREQPASQEVAQGYISPPASNRTSPQITSGTKLISPFGTPHKFLHQSSSLETSPTPDLSQRGSIAPPSIPVENSRLRQHPPSCPSPRSRLARTLLEIQSELADSREGIEAIEQRLDTLERQAPLNRHLLSKHVEDCIRDMEKVLEDSIDTTMGDESVIEGLQLPPAMSNASETTYALPEETSCDTGIQIPWTGKALFYGILGTIAVEWLIMVALDEFGRRQGFKTS